MSTVLASSRPKSRRDDTVLAQGGNPGDTEKKIGSPVGAAQSSSFAIGTSQMSDTIRVKKQVLDEMLVEACREPRSECCGLLAGRDGVISAILPARNALASDTAYEIAPAELFALFRHMRGQGLDHLGIYHSHPSTDNAPSPTDIERAYYPDAACFIISPRADAPRPVRAFRIANGRADELAIETV
jgi:proteasome lid subunit RPN8/RPN11